MKKRHNPVKTKSIQQRYEKQLRAVARHVGSIIEGWDWSVDTAHEITPIVTHMLESYAKQLLPWAITSATRMIKDVDTQATKAWVDHSINLSTHLRHEIRSTHTGEQFRTLLAEQVGLIQSIPLDAAQRVNELTIRGIEGGMRQSEMVQEIMKSGSVSKSKAVLIARTEVARTSASLTQVRAQNAGSTHYIWRTANDTDVRSSHHAMEGKIVAWDAPPSFPDGHSYHAGCFCNCRCWSEVIFSDS